MNSFTFLKDKVWSTSHLLMLRNWLSFPPSKQQFHYGFHSIAILPKPLIHSIYFLALLFLFEVRINIVRLRCQHIFSIVSPEHQGFHASIKLSIGLLLHAQQPIQLPALGRVLLLIQFFDAEPQVAYFLYYAFEFLAQHHVLSSRHVPDLEAL